MLSKISQMRRRWAWSLAPPHIMTCGLPFGSLRISTSVQATPRLQPVPRHFKTASLAAQRPAKCSVDHERLTYLFEGRQRRLTDIGGQNNLAERLRAHES